MKFLRQLSISEEDINGLAKEYKTLNYYSNLCSQLSKLFPNEKFDVYSKYELHKTLNEILLTRYRGEEILKYRLFEYFSKKSNIVAGFEIKVNCSRADFLAINGHTYNFEIKSILDNFSKFKKQAQDYELAFEFNSLIVDEYHLDKAKSLLPEKWGLWVYHNGKYEKYRKPSLNRETDQRTQLNLLTKNELILSFPLANGAIDRILSTYSCAVISRQFKKALKTRYKRRWDFIVSKRKQILPIDLQFFFNNNILPKNIYH
jgi:hypothetical protein